MRRSPCLTAIGGWVVVKLILKIEIMLP